MRREYETQASIVLILSFLIVSFSSKHREKNTESYWREMKIFPIVALLTLFLTACTQVPMGDAKMAVSMASSKKSLTRTANERSADLKSRYVAPRAMSEFTTALTSEGRDWKKHGLYIETLEG